MFLDKQKGCNFVMILREPCKTLSFSLGYPYNSQVRFMGHRYQVYEKYHIANHARRDGVFRLRHCQPRLLSQYGLAQ